MYFCLYNIKDKVHRVKKFLHKILRKKRRFDLRSWIKETMKPPGPQDGSSYNYRESSLQKLLQSKGYIGSPYKNGKILF